MNGLLSLGASGPVPAAAAAGAAPGVAPARDTPLALDGAAAPDGDRFRDLVERCTGAAKTANAPHAGEADTPADETAATEAAAAAAGAATLLPLPAPALPLAAGVEPAHAIEPEDEAAAANPAFALPRAGSAAGIEARLAFPAVVGAFPVAGPEGIAASLPAGQEELPVAPAGEEVSTPAAPVAAAEDVPSPVAFALTPGMRSIVPAPMSAPRDPMPGSPVGAPETGALDAAHPGSAAGPGRGAIELPPGVSPAVTAPAGPDPNPETRPARSARRDRDAFGTRVGSPGLLAAIEVPQARPAVEAAQVQGTTARGARAPQDDVPSRLAPGAQSALDALHASNGDPLAAHHAGAMLHREVLAAREAPGLAPHAPALIAAHQRVEAEMAALVRAGGGTAELELSPPELGRLRLRLSVRNRVVQGSVVVENAAVKQVLEANLDRLQGSLERQGLVFERLDVRLQDSSRGRQHEEAPARPPHRETRDDGRPAGSGDGGGEPEPRRTGSGLVDYWL